MNANPMRTSVAIVVPPNAQSLDLSGPMDAFLEANRLSDGRAPYELSLVAMSYEKMVRVGGMSLVADRSIFEEDRRVDTLLIAGTPDYALAYENTDMVAWLQRGVPLTRRRGSVGTGAFFLGAAGLLNGMNATTHWQHTAELAERCPSARILSDHIYVEDRELYTSAGVTAGIDLALKLIEDDHGRELARKVARRLVVSLRHSGHQSQFGARLVSHGGSDDRIQDLQYWILNHLSLDLTIEALAGRAGMGVRHFMRIFRKEMGTTPADFVECARVNTARQLIETSDMLLHHVASHCGLGNQDVMRCAFIRRIGAGPSLYRKQFQAGAVCDRGHIETPMSVN
jgi:transcriptional regulator GlxA family with amidase domain